MFRVKPAAKLTALCYAEFIQLKGGQRFIKICLSDISIACAFVGGVLGQALGGWDGFLVSLVVFVVVDYITGMLCGIQQGNLASSRGFQGILKKILIFLVVGLGHLLDTALLGGQRRPAALGDDFLLPVQRRPQHHRKPRHPGSSDSQTPETGGGGAGGRGGVATNPIPTNC